MDAYFIIKKIKPRNSQMEEMCRAKCGERGLELPWPLQRETLPASPRGHQPRSSDTFLEGEAGGGGTAVLMLSSRKVGLYEESNYFLFHTVQKPWEAETRAEESMAALAPLLCASSGEGAWARLLNSGINCSRGGPTCCHWSRVLLCKRENCLVCWAERWGIRF